MALLTIPCRLWRAGRSVEKLLAVSVLSTLVGCGGEDAAPAFDIVWVGDILLGDAAQEHLDANGYDWPFEHLAAVMDGDYLIGNGEGPITTLTEPHFPQQQFEYNADPRAADALAAVGFDAIGLSNNHVLDRGSDGFADTVRHLSEAGIRPFGAGLLEEAEAPLIVSTPHGSVAILGFGERWNFGAVGSSTTVGTIPLSPETIQRGHDLATDAGARWLVAYVHWGENYEEVNEAQREAAGLFAEAGYDLVIGHHPHVVQGVEVIDGMPVLYSVGNFTFGTPGRFDEDAPGYGLVVRTSFGTDDEIAVEVSCIVTDNDRVQFQPHPCSMAEARKVYSGLGATVTVRDDGTAALR